LRRPSGVSGWASTMSRRRSKEIGAAWRFVRPASARRMPSRTGGIEREASEAVCGDNGGEMDREGGCGEALGGRGQLHGEKAGAAESGGTPRRAHQRPYWRQEER
jgi:hypothetical protein